MSTRKDTAHVETDLSYPTKADNKGYARKTYAQRLYYFGPHNTADSFVLFGEWRRRLIETGEAPDVKELKAELRTSRLEEDPPELGWRRFALAVAASVLLFAFGSLTTLMISYALADDSTTSLTDEEKEFIRGHRQQGAVLTEAATGRSERIAAALAAVRKGHYNGKDANEGNGS